MLWWKRVANHVIRNIPPGQQLSHFLWLDRSQALKQEINYTPPDRRQIVSGWNRAVSFVRLVSALSVAEWNQKWILGTKRYKVDIAVSWWSCLLLVFSPRQPVKLFTFHDPARGQLNDDHEDDAATVCSLLPVFRLSLIYFITSRIAGTYIDSILRAAWNVSLMFWSVTDKI